MNEVEEYILKQDDSKREILLFLHDLLVNKYQLKPKIRYRVPMYFRNKWMIYLNPDNREGVDFSIINGFKLSEEHILVQSKGRKMVKSVEFKSLEEIPVKELMAIIEEAMEIDKGI